MHGRLAALPDEAEPAQRALLVAVTTVGAEIIELRRTAPRLGLRPELDAALEALAARDAVTAAAGLGRLDRRLAALAKSAPWPSLAARTRGRILAIADALVEYRSYFEAGAPG